MIKSHIEPWMAENHIPGVAVGIYHHGKPAIYYFGVENINTKQPVNQDTIFAVASWTKILTCLLAAETVETGKWSLDDPVVRYLPLLKKNPAFRNITIQELGTYTAGFPANLPETIKTPGELSNFYLHWKPEQPDTRTYSNVSIALLGDALKAQYSQDINTLYIQKILTPLGMQTMGLFIPDNLSTHFAQGYTEDGEPAPLPTFPFVESAAGVKMSASDALKFLHGAINASDVVPILTKAMKITQTPYVQVGDHQQGLALEIYPLHYPLNQSTKQWLLNPPEEPIKGPIPSKAIPKAQQVFHGSYLMDKTGATYGFRSYIVVIPNLKSGVVILTNRYISNGELIRMGRTLLLNFLDDGVY